MLQLHGSLITGFYEWVQGQIAPCPPCNSPAAAQQRADSFLHGVRTLTDREMYWCGGIARINRRSSLNTWNHTGLSCPWDMAVSTYRGMNVNHAIYKFPVLKNAFGAPLPVCCNSSTQELTVSVFLWHANTYKQHTQKIVQCSILFIYVYETPLSSWMLNVDKLIFLSRLSASETSGQTTANIQTENKLKEQ